MTAWGVQSVQHKTYLYNIPAEVKNPSTSLGYVCEELKALEEKQRSLKSREATFEIQGAQQSATQKRMSTNGNVNSVKSLQKGTIIKGKSGLVVPV